MDSVIKYLLKEVSHLKIYVSIYNMTYHVEFVNPILNFDDTP